MERLTFRTNQRVYLKKFDCPYDMPIQKRLFCIGCHVQKIGNRENCGPLKVIDRLAAYEDTELTPEQVASLKAENAKLKAENQKLKAERDMAIEDIKYIDSNYSPYLNEDELFAKYYQGELNNENH